jgi:hypothetical protein
MCKLCVLTDSYYKSEQKISLNAYIQEKLKSDTALFSHSCKLLKEIPVLPPNIKHVYCGNCPLLKEIPVLPNITVLYCYNCPLLKEIPELPNLQTLLCCDCPLLKEIPYFPNIRELNCCGCRLLRIICNENMEILYRKRCPLLFYSPHIPENKLKINKLRKFIRNHKYFTFRRWMKSKEFCEHYYSPDNKAGKMVKEQLLNFVSGDMKN